MNIYLGRVDNCGEIINSHHSEIGDSKGTSLVLLRFKLIKPSQISKSLGILRYLIQAF